MLRIKRLYTFIIQTFLPIFMMTFGICLFIVLMQFLWKFVEDLVGKGLDNIVLAELFLYALLSLIPMALPLALLLASLMAFGNLGERLELLAIKASGVSLLKTMMPLIIFVSCVAIGAFFFQNEAMPRIQVKLRSLMISIRQKSPELDIPEGSFYNGITNYNLYVKKKDKETRMLKDVMIYDTSEGFDNMSVFVCDSALMNVSSDKSYLLLNLYSGQRFANFRQSGLSDARRNNQFVPYGRENFKEKKIIIPFNTGFDRMDESNLEGTQISKNIVQLGNSIDSLNSRLDSVNIHDRRIIGKFTYLTYRNSDTYKKTGQTQEKDKEQPKPEQTKAEKPPIRIDFDSLLSTYSRDELSRYVGTAANDAESSRFNIMETTQKINLQKNIRMHKIEWHRKFVLSFACLIFFFIGAPLGAIIRKGGLGMPVVVSVLLFIVYYIIDNIGYKMARDGVWEVWQGMWLSSFALFPLGVFLTYKAMNDSALFNPEAYGNFFRKILGLKKKVINENQTTVDVNTVPELSTLNADPELVASLQNMSIDNLKDIVRNHQQYGYGEDKLQVILSVLKDKGDDLFDIRIKNIEYEEAKKIYRATIKNLKIMLTLNIASYIIWPLVPVFYYFYARTFICYFDFYRAIDRKTKKDTAGIMIVSLVFSFIVYTHIKNRMREDMESIKW
ncbi:YjgP/YjgQ family permease [Dysgonomonas sp. 521]|uniref:LptF/LptG family permease n=1 Tax=Dysgonomonas sp. 521 TaxID=2302932 RepID=UPI0013D6D83D|nr:LptF/LptG family permease [Dysgonomonas sp. 521]NDV95273.1 YjgP/YjgQ family permease [Dysgonomonas sp. 521]